MYMSYRQIRIYIKINTKMFGVILQFLGNPLLSSSIPSPT